MEVATDLSFHIVTYISEKNVGLGSSIDLKNECALAVDCGGAGLSGLMIGKSCICHNREVFRFH